MLRRVNTWVNQELFSIFAVKLIKTTNYKLMKPTLFLLAAGMGSRYGGLKQLDGL